MEFDHQPADARNGEDRLGDDGAAKQRADREAEQRDGRDQRVPQHVAGQDQPRAQPLGAGEGDVFGADHLEDGGAQVAHQHGGEAQGERQRRQEQMVEVLAKSVAVAADREPAQIRGEDREQHQPDIEDRHRQADLEGAADDAVGRADGA